jgi:hypothetical protein
VVDRVAQLEADRVAQLEADRVAQSEADRVAQSEVDRVAQSEVDRDLDFEQIDRSPGLRQQSEDRKYDNRRRSVAVLV